MSDTPRAPLVLDNPWTALREHTPARIALGRVGASQPTDALLTFSLAHARARDAVHEPLQVADLVASLSAEGFDAVTVHSRAADRPTYLRRPDLGRRLDETSVARLDALQGVGETAGTPGPDLVFVVADGLSSLAVTRHAVALLAAVRPLLGALAIAPVIVAEQSRVALGDEVGERLAAGMVAVLIGERPGLSSPDSLGVYLTWAPRVGRSDAERNCVSNIRPEGLDYASAAARLAWLVDGARRLQLTGVALKDDSDAALLPDPRPAG